MLPICLILLILSVGTSFCQSEFLLSGQSEGISSCRTVGGPSQGKPCQFPFIFGGEERRGCISDTDPEQRLWCSTRVDTEGRHVAGGEHWAHCGPGCPVSVSAPGGPGVWSILQVSSVCLRNTNCLLRRQTIHHSCNKYNSPKFYIIHFTHFMYNFISPG